MGFAVTLMWTIISLLAFLQTGSAWWLLSLALAGSAFGSILINAKER